MLLREHVGKGAFQPGVLLPQGLVIAPGDLHVGKVLHLGQDGLPQKPAADRRIVVPVVAIGSLGAVDVPFIDRVALGDDRVELHRNGFTELASLVIRTGNGDDWVEAIGCTFQSHVKMQTNDGQDVVYVATSRFRKLAAFKTGKMDDEIELERSTFDAALRVNGGGGLNAVFFISINGAGAAGGGSGDGDKFYWRFVIVHVLP